MADDRSHKRSPLKRVTEPLASINERMTTEATPDASLLAMMDEARADLAMNETNIHEVSMNQPRLVEKYARKMMMAKASLKREDMKLAAVKADLHAYYVGSSNGRGAPLKLNNREDVATHIAGDQKYIAQQSVVELLKLKVEYIQAIMGAISGMSFNAGNAIKMILFRAGER